MNTRARDQVLTSVKLALGFPADDDTLFTAEDPSTTTSRQVPERAWQDLETQTAAISTRIYRSNKLHEAHDTVRAIIKEHAAKKVVRWEHPLLEAFKIDDLLREAGVDLCPRTIEREKFQQWSAQADLGITAAEGILVESGALIIRAQKGQERSTSLLPPAHLAIITSEQRLQSLRDLAPLLREWMDKDGRLPSAIHLVAGPSRTADIEFTLILGAHGPKDLHLLVLDSACFPDIKP